MGCTSSKPNRTKSFEDINSTKTAESSKQQNGHVGGTSEQSKIPKSFLAPDDIPFIDEEVVENQRSTAILTNAQKNLSGAVEIESYTSVLLPEVQITKSPLENGAVVVQEVQDPITDSANIQSHKTSLDDETAAIKIQAGVRGFIERKKVQAIREQRMGGGGPRNNEDHPKVGREVREVTGEDEAATKIQARYRGYITRKQIDANK